MGSQIRCRSCRHPHYNADCTEKCGCSKFVKPKKRFASKPVLETDEALRQRLCDAIPQGATYTAEDIGTASGEQLDAIAAQYNIKREGLS